MCGAFLCWPPRTRPSRQELTGGETDARIQKQHGYLCHDRRNDEISLDEVERIVI
jgi:hypothetical protein